MVFDYNRSEGDYMKIAILGCGAYGLALASQFFKRKENQIIVYTKFESEKQEVEELHCREQVLPGVELPSLTVTLSLEEALINADFVVMAVPFFAVEKTLEEMKPFLSSDTTLVFASKGLRETDGKPAPFLYQEAVLSNPLIVLSGPTFAKDLARSEQVTLTIASSNQGALEEFSTCFPDNIHIEFSKDVYGISYCGALKNIFAILHGYFVGKKVSASTLAMLLYKSLHQIEEFLIEMDCQKETILLAAGVGDFYMTAESMESRNHTFGYMLSTASKEEVQQYLKKTTVEGVYTLNACCNLLREEGLIEKFPVFFLLQDLLTGKDVSSEEIIEAICTC